MPTTPVFSYPTSAEIMEIDPFLLDAEIKEDPLLGPEGLFGMEYTDADMLIWEQRDFVHGLMQFRGLNGEPAKVARLKRNQYKVEPGQYGEYLEVDEAEMTRRAQPATFNMPVKVDDLVAECQVQLVTRQTNRMRYICTQLLVNGTYIVLDKDGTIGVQDNMTQQIYTAPITWATQATAKPLYDFRQLPILARGNSTNFGVKAEAWMTQVTFNNLIGNTNTNDIRGERLDNNRTVESVADVNLVLTRNNLPQIRIYEDGYYDDAGAFHTYIPDTIVLVVGKRANNAPLGKFRMTKNMAAPGGKGVYDKVITRGMLDDEPPPPKIDVHRGFNGGPVLFYPKSIFIMQT
jgi:hypothetical protein